MIRSIILLLTVYLCLPFFGIAQPVPNFSADPVEGCSPLVVRFTDQTTGSPTAWLWDFGNGATSTLRNPSTTYFNPGKYPVTLTVTNADGSRTITRPDLITVFSNPQVFFTVNDSVGCRPFGARFTDQSVAGPGTVVTNWFWDFGDGTQSQEQNPVHQYANDGSYTVSLYVGTDKGCRGSATKLNYINVEGGVQAAFDFVYPPVCHPPFDVQFTSSSTGPGQLTYTWQFGDGSTGSDEAPVHTYAAPGLYSVSLIVLSSQGCSDTVRKEGLLDLGNTTTGFTAPDSVCLGVPVQFSNTSSAVGSSRWDFGDGTTSTAASPLKTYNAPGVYTVRLSQAYGNCADSASKQVVVSPRPEARFSADNLVACQPPLAVNFQNSSTGAVRYLWNFGDSTTSTDADPSHTYTNLGNFQVTLVATNAEGCSDTSALPEPIIVSKPVIRFPALPTIGCIPYTAGFRATITAADSVISYSWDLGNGVTSTEANPVNTYTAQGAYTVSLTVTTTGGCTETLTVPNAVVVGRKPQVNFNALPDTACASEFVQFNNEVPEFTVLYWSFGDGGNSTQANPLYQYTDTGSFTVTLVAENSGCRDTLEKPKYITIKPPIARFDFQVDCQNKLLYSFRDRSIGATAWNWDFGDGNTSTEQSPVHTYSGFGRYTVTLTVTNDTCSHTVARPVIVSIGKPDFSAQPTVACKGTPIQLVADTTNAANIVAYSWNFGNGTVGSGRSTSAVYTAAGYYTVTLSVRDVNGCVDTVVRPNLVLANGPTAALTASNNIGCKGLSAVFNDASRDDSRSAIVAWEWTLGDGTTVNRTSSASVQHLYSQPGRFDVGLKVTDGNGCSDRVLMPALVHTSDIVARFVSADTLSCPGAVVRFSNTSSAAPPYTSEWLFGNGTTSTDQNPTASFANEGLYSVRLKVTDVFGCTDTLSRPNYITVKRPVASFTVNDSATSCVPFQVLYTNTSSYYNQHVWDLGGGTTFLQNPTQFYNATGVYTTKLIVTSPGGCRDTATKQISVYDISTSSLSYLPLTGCTPLVVDIAALTPVKMDYIWDFGDGTILNSNDTVTRHTYTFFGDFVPKLIMKNNSGCVVAITGADTVSIRGAKARFGVDTQLLCDSGTVYFSDSTTFNVPVASYQWNFGDGATSGLTSPAHHYSQPGVYNVSLNIRTENNCRDTFNLSLPVKVVASPAIQITGDTVICAGEGIQYVGRFERPDTSAVRWAWTFPNGNASAVQVPQRQIYRNPGDFSVLAVAQNSSGCTDTASLPLRVNPIPTITLPSVITTTVGTPVVLPAIYSGPMRQYNWSIPEGLSCTNCPQPVATPKFNTKYTVQVTDPNGCRNEAGVQVIVLCNNDNVFIPNTFSPNGDGSNDIFYIRGKGLNRVKSLRIFNRWGQVVFEKFNFNVNDINAGWDGTYKGAKPVPDVYVYQAEVFCDNSEAVKLEGNVALIQ